MSVATPSRPLGSADMATGSADMATGSAGSATGPADPTAGAVDTVADSADTATGSADSAAVPAEAGTSADPRLAAAVELARASLADVGEEGVGDYLGVTLEAPDTATHRFDSTLPGYRGWQWAVVVAGVPGSDAVTVSESALLPGPDALVAPAWLPWDQRVRAGDLRPGDLLPPPQEDARLAPGFMGTGDTELDELAREVGLGRKQVLSLDGRADAAQRWFDGDFGPSAPMAKSAAETCGTCGFYLPLAGALRAEFGVCANEYALDGRVVHCMFGCGAHSDTPHPVIAALPEPFDDEAIDPVRPRRRNR